MTLRTKVIAASGFVAVISILSLANQGAAPARRTTFIRSAVQNVDPIPAAPRAALKHHRHAQTNPKPMPPATKMGSPSQAATAVTAAPLSRMVGQMVMAKMTGTSPDAQLLARIRDGQVGGVILYGEDIVSPDQVAQLDRTLQDTARLGRNPPLLISTDQGGGLVKRLPWAAPTIAPPEMGSAGAAISESQGQQAGVAMHDVGVNVDLAPVADVAHSSSVFIWQQRRSFGMNPSAVATGASAFALGMESARVAPTAKHFPGAGGFAVDTDFALQKIDLTSVDTAPYTTLISQQIPIIMVSTGVYPNVDPLNPAALSRQIVTEMLRHKLGYGGVVMTDDLERPTGHTTGEAAVMAAQAGDDIILVSTSEGGGVEAYAAMLAAAQSGRIPRANINAAYQRILALKQQYTGA